MFFKGNVFIETFYSFIALTEDLLHEISLIEVVGCTLNICFLGYYSMMV